MDPSILDICREDSRFSYEAYEFVCDAVTYAMKRLGRTGDSPDERDEDQHVSGSELLRGVCELAIEQFGMMAPVVFKQWGIRTTDDVGTMVFNLIRVERLSKSERDVPDDFHDLFDLPQALAEGFSLTLGDAQPVRRGER